MRRELKSDRRLQEQLNLYYVLDPDKDNLISSTDEPTQFFLPQIDFLSWQPEYSPFVNCFRYDTTDCNIKPSSRFQEWTAELQEYKKKI